MTDDAKKPAAIERPGLKIVTPAGTPADALDLGNLWLDPALGDGITDTHFHSIPVGKPRDFFRVCPDPAYRRRGEIVTIKSETSIEEQHYIVHPNMQGRILEARPATVCACIYRDGSLRLWPLKFAKEGERDNEVWTSARKAAREAIDRWIKLVWLRRAYQTRDAQPGYAPDPDWSKLPSFDEMIRLGFGVHGVIADEDHPVYRDLMGAPTKASGDGDDL